MERTNHLGRVIVVLIAVVICGHTLRAAEEQQTPLEEASGSFFYTLDITYTPLDRIQIIMPRGEVQHYWYMVYAVGNFSDAMRDVNIGAQITTDTDATSHTLVETIVAGRIRKDESVAVLIAKKAGNMVKEKKNTLNARIDELQKNIENERERKNTTTIAYLRDIIQQNIDDMQAEIEKNTMILEKIDENFDPEAEPVLRDFLEINGPIKTGEVKYGYFVFEGIDPQARQIGVHIDGLTNNVDERTDEQGRRYLISQVFSIVYERYGGVADKLYFQHDGFEWLDQDRIYLDESE